MLRYDVFFEKATTTAWKKQQKKLRGVFPKQQKNRNQISAAVHRSAWPFKYAALFYKKSFGDPPGKYLKALVQ